MSKKIFILILLFFVTSCGYEAIHSNKNSLNYNFSISQLTFFGNRAANLKIKEKLNTYTLNKKNKNYVLKISSDVEKIIIAKDVSGDPTSFKLTVIINVESLMDNNFKNSLQIKENFNYNNNSNKFDLKRYEVEIINNLTESITAKLIYKLSNIQ
ncbi:hypothetical protein N8267_02955 [Pelagibacteraceae bacterium]|nr:hypothetical protein [Pelagibacteraceae bacterium]